jgi:Protein of unknown function (DUF402)
MSETSREDQAVSDSGGTMTRLTTPPRVVTPDLSVLGSLRRSAYDDPVRPAGVPPYFEPGQVVTWHYGHSAEVLRVVRDDERGLVAWLASGSERLVATPRDGRAIRDRPLEERYALAVAGEYDLTVAPWHGPGLLRIAPTGVPWSIWFFTDEDGSFEGHYVNLELVHERPVGGSPRVQTRDLTLDLWLEDGETWLKDADELEAAVAAGWCTAEQAAVVHDIADQTRRELIDPRAWPLDEGWETWRPPDGWDEPLALPASVALPP